MTDTKKQPAFDRFIHDFAATNMQSRVKWVCLISFVLMVFTLLGCFLLLNQRFQVFVTGFTSIENTNTISITLDQKYEKLVNPALKLALIHNDQELPCAFDVQSLQKDNDGLNVALVLKTCLEKFKDTPSVEYKLYLEDKTYLKMLLEKVEE